MEKAMGSEYAPDGCREEALTIRKLYRRFGATEALRGISLTVGRGSLTGLVGSDGAGKTTLIRIVAGLLSPDGGEVLLFEGQSVNHRREMPAVGYLSQGFSLYGDLSIDENMRFFASLYGFRRYRERSTELLRLVGLEAFRTRRAGKLSGGMKKKLALACALIHNPPLLLLDEPTTGVDPVSRREFWAILTTLQHEGMSVLMATPYFDEAERCDQVILMHDGVAVERGTPEAVSATASGAILEVVCSPIRSAAEVLAGDERILEVQLYGDRIHIRLHDRIEDSAAEESLRSKLTGACVRVATIRRVRPSLENAFISHMNSRRSSVREPEAS